MPAACGRYLLASKMRATKLGTVEHDGIAARNDAGKGAITLGSLHSCSARCIAPDSGIVAIHSPGTRVGELLEANGNAIQRACWHSEA